MACSESKEATDPFPFPVYLFHVAVPELYPFITNWQSDDGNVSQTSVNCSSILIRPEEGVMGTLEAQVTVWT